MFPTPRFLPRCPSLLPAIETVVSVRWRPCGQNREGFAAGPTSPATNPDAAMPFIVRLLAPPAMAHDSVIAASWTLPRQQLQGEWGYPGSGLFSSSGSAIKRIKAGVKAHPLNARSRLNLDAGLHPPIKSARTKKEYLFRTVCAPTRVESHLAMGTAALFARCSISSAQSVARTTTVSAEAQPPGAKSSLGVVQSRK